MKYVLLALLLLPSIGWAQAPSKFSAEGQRQEVLLEHKDSAGAARCKTIAEWATQAFTARSDKFRFEASGVIAKLAADKRKLGPHDVDECRKAAVRLTASKDPAVRERGLIALATVGDSTSVPVLSSIVLAGGQYGEPRLAVESLQAIGNADARKALESLEKRVKDKAVLEGIQEALDELDAKAKP